MFDSRTDASVFPGTHTYGHAERADFREMSTGGKRRDMPWTVRHLQPAYPTKAQAIAEGLIEAEVGYADALEAPECMEDLMAEAFAWLEEHEADIAHLDAVEQAQQDAIDAALDGYSDDHWMPFMRGAQEMAEMFEHGYHVITTNMVRTSALHYTEKEKVMQDKETERVQALHAAQAQRERHLKLAAQLEASDKAKVVRPLPVPHAEHPEPAPYDKFGGRYNEALDPISPNFDRSAW